MSSRRYRTVGAGGAVGAVAALILGATVALACQPTSITTSLKASSIPVGSSVSDTANLSGTEVSVATGTVTYAVYTNNSCTSLAASPVISGQPAAVTVANGIVPNSPPVTFDQLGTFYWRASYSGDGVHNLYSISTCGAEVLTVVKATPGITTTLTSASIPVGSTDSDKANLSGGYLPTGSVTFKVYTNTLCTVLATTGSGNDISAQPVPAAVSVNGDGSYSSGSVTFYQATPTYYWQAAYSGDGNNIGVTSACTSEVTTVTKDGPSISTQLSATAIPVGNTASDTATLTGATSNATGTVTFTIYSDACTTMATTGTGNEINVQAGSAAVSGNGTYASATVKFYKAGTYYWQAVYSGDANNVSAKSACGSEIVTVSTTSTPTPTPTSTPTPTPHSTPTPTPTGSVLGSTPTPTPSGAVLAISVPDTGGAGPTGGGWGWLSPILVLLGSLVVVAQFVVRRRVRSGKIKIQDI